MSIKINNTKVTPTWGGSGLSRVNFNGTRVWPDQYMIREVDYLYGSSHSTLDLTTYKYYDFPYDIELPGCESIGGTSGIFLYNYKTNILNSFSYNAAIDIPQIRYRSTPNSIRAVVNIDTSPANSVMRFTTYARGTSPRISMTMSNVAGRIAAAPFILDNNPTEGRITMFDSKGLSLSGYSMGEIVVLVHNPSNTPPIVREGGSVTIGFVGNKGPAGNQQTPIEAKVEEINTVSGDEMVDVGRKDIILPSTLKYDPSFLLNCRILNLRCRGYHNQNGTISEERLNITTAYYTDFCKE